MAEATDRPQSTGEVPPSAAVWPEGAGAVGEESGAMPPASESYQPLSLLALAAFALAVMYGLIVVVGGAVALVNRSPWLMPTWTFLIPLAVLIVCWAARSRIRNAEGALSGLAFTVWGVRLTVVIGLTYLAYYGFTFFAVRLQAQEYADQFFEQLKQGHSERAFLLAAGLSPNDMDDAEMRDMLEVRFNSSGGPGGSAGLFSQFCQSEFVRTIEMGGAETHIASRGVADWGYSKAGYQVVMTYQISCPLADFEMRVEMFGRDSKPGEPKGRQWQVNMQKGATGVVPTSVKPTPHGEDFMKKAQAAQSFAMRWSEKIARQQWDEAYLDTLAPAERERLRKSWKASDLSSTAPLAGPALLGLGDEAGRGLSNGRQMLTTGKLIHLDDKKVWTSKRDRAAILQRVENTFRPGSGGKSLLQIRLQTTLTPLSRFEEGQRLYLFDSQFIYLDEETETPTYVAQGYLVVTAKEGEEERFVSPWRIAGIEISSVRTPPKTEGPRPPGSRLGGRL